MHTALLRELPERAKRELFKVERWCTPDEGLVLYALIQAHEIRSYLECGTANGYSALWAAAALEGVERSYLHTWDVHDRPKIWDQEAELGDLSARIRCHQGPFADGVGNVYAPGPRLYFIDGEHNHTATRADWRAARLLIQKGDVIVFHDVIDYENLMELCNNLRTIHGYRGGVVRTQRGMGVYFA